MPQYVLDHHLEGEKKRLALMSQLLDPMHRRHIEALRISRDAQVLEIGCGNGSMSRWMAIWWTQTITFTGEHRR
jgi:2-polyprenyl-3-methyl-5-hydroxy-6-metoxy-1,4-benzoquinol methylase